MAEYIKRDVVMKEIMAAKWMDGYDGAMAMAISVSAPAADVAPVVHGRWLKPHWALGRQRVCSVCHNTVQMPSFDSGEYAEYPGCPWCLAKMDGDDADRGRG